MAKNDPDGFPGTLQSMIPDADMLFAAFAGMISEPDKKLMMMPEITSSFKRDCVETLAQGHAAIAIDFILATNSWGFDLGTIHAHVHIWNGIEDLNVPSSMAEYFAKNCRTTKSGCFPVKATCACSAIGKRFFTQPRIAERLLENLNVTRELIGGRLVPY